VACNHTVTQSHNHIVLQSSSHLPVSVFLKFSNQKLIYKYKHSIRYFNIAKGSSAEVITQAIIAFEIGYIVVEEKENIVSQCELISKKLSKLIKYRSNNK